MMSVIHIYGSIHLVGFFDCGEFRDLRQRYILNNRIRVWHIKLDALACIEIKSKYLTIDKVKKYIQFFLLFCPTTGQSSVAVSPTSFCPGPVIVKKCYLK